MFFQADLLITRYFPCTRSRTSKRSATPKIMAGGTIFEERISLPRSEHLDWVPQDKDLLQGPMPSPTNSHSTDSAASPYNMPQTASTSYHPYPPAGPASQPRYTHQPQYNSSGEYDVFQTPTQPHRAGLPYPQPIIYEQDQLPHLTATSGPRSYDTTIPQYYPIMAERSWSQTPDKAGKRKRAEKSKEAATPAPVQAVKTPKRSKGGSEERAAKRSRTASQAESQSQLPTPPSTGRDLPSVGLPSHLQPAKPVEESLPPVEETLEPEPRRGLKVLQSEEEGRKLAVGQVLEEEEAGQAESKSLRLAPAPTIITAKNGSATLETLPILESELSWLENAGRPLTPTPPPLALPTLLDPPIYPDEEADAPDVKAEKVSKRLRAFSITARSEPMTCTKIDAFGRVAVRKDAALKFLGLEAADSLIEERKEEDEWVESSVASSSRARVKPSWPDELAPWSIGGGRVKRMREEKERDVLLKRYMEHSGDEASDEEIIYPSVHGKGKGKSITQLVRVPDGADPRRRIRPDLNVDTDARSALLTALRYRSLPPLPVGIVACACGARSSNGVSAMVVCTNCQTWHHTICNGVDEHMMPARWWCPNCENQVLRLATPAQTPRRAYRQSEERSSAFKGQADNIALAPSPIFASSSQFSQAGPSVSTPANRGGIASPTSRNHRSRILSYGSDMWAPFGEEPGAVQAPTTPVPSDTRFTTPRIDDAPFDVTSTPSRHLDFNFGAPSSLFALTPLGGRSRVTSNMMSDTPLTYRHRLASHSENQAMSGRHDFLRDLAGPSAVGPPSPSSAGRRGPSLLGAGSIGSASMGHRRTLSGNKMSSMRNSSRSGLGLGMPIGVSHDDEDAERGEEAEDDPTIDEEI
ncbi:uncharacterized protein MKK02DRAFT_44576 [Dioszegia hungarica]|uniref:Zinc finger PHD-type domain-containing protein n=1 Tax=Dioszegia hungarica TaxID=4972 RepID=A0AA38LVR3_9TREE|nr:uncharacterized protein MKK02DRAFT_44576 [Dioszegia hungarica]KAI9635879.1 hypothetical protein MKK02DRAFT_44576 [Dioszegia hungarica]